MTEVAIAIATLNRMLELGRPEYVRLPWRGADCARLLIRATKSRLAHPDATRLAGLCIGAF